MLLTEHRAIQNRSNKKIKMTKSGFTLLEVLLAATLFTMGVIAVVWLFSAGLVSSVDAENTTVAMNLARQKMEEIKNLAFAGISDEPREAVSGFAGFEREVTVTQPETGLKHVTTTVYWMLKGDEISVPLKTYISSN